MHRMKYSFATAVVSMGLLLGCWKGRVALFQAGDPDPVQVYPVSITLLPPADQKALEDKIAIGSAAELTTLLEDLLS